MKKAQIINKILNKILIITALLYNIFSILAIKKEKHFNFSFLLLYRLFILPRYWLQPPLLLPLILCFCG